MGPALPTEDVYLRTAVNVGREGWAHFGHVAMKDYRWGIFLAERDTDRRIGFGEHKGEPAWQKVPGEYRAELQRLIVIQGDTEPACVEQQRNLGATAPSLYDLRNLFQVNVEEGRHLWAMVYLLHAYFGREGREEAEELLHRNSGSEDAPRILGAFNEETPDWLSFFMFTYFTDRDGKYQLGTLKESAFDPLSAPASSCSRRRPTTCSSAPPASTGWSSAPRRSWSRTTPTTWPGYGGIPLEVIQKYLNFHYCVSLDLFGGETSTNVANYYTAGLKGRWPEDRRKDDHCSPTTPSRSTRWSSGDIGQTEVAALVGLNTDLRREYIADCQSGVNRWNRILDEAGLHPAAARCRTRRSTARSARSPASRRRRTGGADRRRVGRRSRGKWLPTETDKTYVRSLMQPVHERGKIAAWIAPPQAGHQRPAVRLRLRAPRLTGRAAMTRFNACDTCSTGGSRPATGAGSR